MAAHPQMNRMHGLCGARPSDYQGTHLPAVAEIRQHAELIEIRATGRTALVLVREGTDVHLIRATRCDEPGLEVLSPSDRAKVAAAVATLHRDGGPADAA